MGKVAKRAGMQKTATKNPTERLEDYNEVMSKNKALTEALCESNECYQSILSERNKLQRENLELIIQNRELNNRLIKINMWSRSLLDTAIKGSELTTNIIYQSHAENDSEASHSSDFSHNDNNNNTSTKTQAVKPMVSGHVIHRPIINLPRVPTEELVRLGSSHHFTSNRAEAATTSPISTFVSESDAGEGTSSSSPDVMRRLSTLHEVENESVDASPRNSNKRVSNTPLLSGIFNDVRVYLSPTDRVFPIQVNNKLIPFPSPSTITKRIKKKRGGTEDLRATNVSPVKTIKVDRSNGDESGVMDLANPTTRVTRRTNRVEPNTSQSRISSLNNTRTRRSAAMTRTH